jgi:hypothetical protein
MIGSVGSVLGGITSKLTSWKGPESLDKVILEPSGQMVIGGFIKGLRKEIPGIKKTLNAVTGNIPSQFGTPAFSGAGSRGGGSTTNLVFTGPIYSDSQGLKRLVNEVGPLVQQKFSKKSKQNAGNVGF